MVSIVLTTPLICGRQASETMAMRNSCLLRGHLLGNVMRDEVGFGALFGPMDDAQAALEILDQRCAALDPGAAAAIEDTVDGGDLGVMDVAADHAVDAAALGLARDGLFVVGDELDRV